MNEPLLLRRARRSSGGALEDLLVRDGRVVRGEADAAVETIDLDGRLVLPGRWDAHVHLDQWAAARQRLDLAGTTSAAQVVALVRDRRLTAAPPDGTVLIGFGFRDGLWPDAPLASLLDEVAPDVPVVLVSGDLHCAWFNTVALQRFGRADHPTGLLRETEWLSIMNDVSKVPDEVGDAWAAQATAAAARRGVVGIVDFEAPDNTPAWVRRISAGTTELRVRCAVWSSHLERAIERGRRTGEVVDGTGGLAVMGPLKVITDGSLNTRTAYCHEPYAGLTGPDACGVLACAPDELVPLMTRARGAGLETAIHAIGDHANSLTLDAFAAVGSRGSVEHAQLLDDVDVARFAALGVIASVQPEHLVDDRDVADRYWRSRTRRAFAFRSLLDAGAQLALGSDAPVAPLDPWMAIASAVHRTKDGRSSWHPEQALTVDEALAASSGGRGVVLDGEVADLVVLDADPWTASVSELREMPVAGTMIAGRWTHRGGI